MSIVVKKKGGFRPPKMQYCVQKGHKLVDTASGN